MSTPRFNSIEEYLAALDATKASTLRAVIDFILAQFPELAVKLAWNVPQIHRDGQYVFGLSAAKNHLALAPWSTLVIDAYRERLEAAGYVVKQNLFQIPVDWEINGELVKELVQARLAELD